MGYKWVALVAKRNYQSNSVEQQSTKRWKVIENTHVLQLPLERRDLLAE